MYKKIIRILLCLLMLSACGARGQNREPLTEQQLEQANQAFQPLVGMVVDGQTVTQVNAACCFFTSNYSHPSALDLGEFLRYCPNGTTLEDSDAEEFQAVILASGMGLTGSLPSEFVVPIHRYPRNEVSALLKQYANITVDDLESTEDALYLEEYDAFYTFTSDFAPGYFQCTGGEQQGHTIRFWSELREDGTRAVLTVQEMDGAYYIASFLNEKEDAGSLK